MNKTRKLKRDSIGDLMYRLAALHAELDNPVTPPARRVQLKQQIAELTAKMMATTERV